MTQRPAIDGSFLFLTVHEDGTWTCRLNVRHGRPGEESCPHFRPGDYDYCSSCAPYECHHEHDHP